MEYIPYNGQYSGTQIDALLTKINSFGGLYSDTTTGWNNHPTTRSIKDAIYVYTDHSVVDGQNVPAIKIGDGNAYVIDLPFIMTGVTITQSDIDNWNSKVDVKIDNNNPENLIIFR